MKRLFGRTKKPPREAPQIAGGFPDSAEGPDLATARAEGHFDADGKGPRSRRPAARREDFIFRKQEEAVGAELPRAGAKVFVLYYSGVITGSKELRQYNEEMGASWYTNKPKLNTPMNFYSNYDGEWTDDGTWKKGPKAKEPFFDAFLVHLALLKMHREEGSLKSIKYYKTNINDLAVEYDPETSSLRNEVEDSVVTRDEMDYENAKHIFILSPTTEQMVEDIKEICGKAQKNVIIHIQGSPSGEKTTWVKTSKEDHPGAPGTDGSLDNGLTSNDGMFPDAFNLFSGGKDVIEMRNYFKSLGAQVLTVSPVTGTEWKEQEQICPKYYQDVNEDVIQLSKYPNTQIKSDYEFYNNLDVGNVFQDGTDKDNLASLILLGRINYQQQCIPVTFIGLRIYRSTSRGFDADKVDPGGVVPGEKVHTFNLEGGNVIHNEEYSAKPDIRPDQGNLPFAQEEKKLTLTFYENQRTGFVRTLGKYAGSISVDMKEWNKKDLEKFIVDGVEPLSKSQRAPFNMAMFTFARNTYQEDAIKRATCKKSWKDAMLEIKCQPVPGSEEDKSRPAKRRWFSSLRRKQKTAGAEQKTSGAGARTRKKRNGMRRKTKRMRIKTKRMRRKTKKRR